MIVMDVEIISQESDLIELRVSSLTVAEILRVYLNDRGIKFAAWRRDHLTKPVLFRIESSGKGVKKAISEAVSAVNKDLNSLLKVVGK
jgi:DNA-directed RNA polymerase subunit L